MRLEERKAPMLLAWGLLTVILLYYRSFTMREAASISIPKFRIRQEKWEAGFACLTVIVKRSKAIMQSMIIQKGIVQSKTYKTDARKYKTLKKLFMRVLF